MSLMFLQVPTPLVSYMRWSTDVETLEPLPFQRFCVFMPSDSRMITSL